MKETIIIFTRVPIPGQTKTRFMPHLRPEECAALHKCFLKDIYTECRKAGRDLYVFYTPEGKEEVLHPVLGEETVYRVQRGEGLGERMLHAIQAVLAEGYESCVLIGTDVPEIKASDLRSAFHQLKISDVVFGPTADGGYYLVGMKQPYEAVFKKQIYGHETVLENTVSALRETNLQSAYVNMYDDMDCPEDLRGFYYRMRGNPDLQNSHTGRYLLKHIKISIIIPIYNEEKTIDKLQKQLYSLKDQCEIIFVDGGSTDGTLEKIAPDLMVIHSEKGRAGQMNTGAQASRGDILFFLHCDSELPEQAPAQIRYVMKESRIGGFGIAFHSRNFFMLTNRIISNYRMKHRGIIFGDQGIFMERKLFFEMGMFPRLPIMEDYQFSLNLLERGIKIGSAKQRIYTSDRRYPAGTIPKLRVMCKMFRLRRLYRSGVSAEKISDLYHDVR